MAKVTFKPVQTNNLTRLMQQCEVYTYTTTTGITLWWFVPHNLSVVHAALVNSKLPTNTVLVNTKNAHGVSSITAALTQQPYLPCSTTLRIARINKSAKTPVVTSNQLNNSPIQDWQVVAHFAKVPNATHYLAISRNPIGHCYQVTIAPHTSPTRQPQLAITLQPTPSTQVYTQYIPTYLLLHNLTNSNWALYASNDDSQAQTTSWPGSADYAQTLINNYIHCCNTLASNLTNFLYASLHMPKNNAGYDCLNLSLQTLLCNYLTTYFTPGN